MYAEFGSKVTILEGGRFFMPREDRDIANSVREVLERKGIEIRLNARAQSIHDTADGVTLAYTDASDGTPYFIDGDAILLATGRKPMIDGLKSSSSRRTSRFTRCNHHRCTSAYYHSAYMGDGRCERRSAIYLCLFGRLPDYS